MVCNFKIRKKGLLSIFGFFAKKTLFLTKIPIKRHGNNYQRTPII